MTAADLVHVGVFGRIARRVGIRETDRTLMLTGRLTRVAVGRRDYYPLAEILDAAPGPYWPLITTDRADLAEAEHTITIERCDRETADAQWDIAERRALIGRPAVIERHHGRLFKVCHLDGKNPRYGDTLEQIALGAAHIYRAEYVPAVTA